MVFFSASEKENNVIYDTFNTDSKSRNLIVVISDIHLGANFSYAEIEDNLEPLKSFLEQIRASCSVKELVIAGDLLDEWFVPATTDTYNGKNQSDFVQQIAATNKTVIDKLNQIIQEGEIKVNRYKGIQDNWTERCIENNVAVAIPAADAFKYAWSATGTDTTAVIQYFSNPNSTKRVVIFGHTHVAKIKMYNNYNGQKSIYANSGTWIDENPDGSTMNFVVITPQSNDTDSQTLVTLYNFANEMGTEMAKDSLRL